MFRDVYWLRDATSKAVRRVKKLIGRADPTPWVLRPNRPAVDGSGGGLVVALGTAEEGASLIRTLGQAMAQYGLNLRVMNGEDVGAGHGTPQAYLDLSPDSAARAGGAHVICDPAKRKDWADRSRAHQKLKEAGLPMAAAADFQARRAVRFPGRTSYLRGYTLLGARTLLWWTPEGGRYDLLAWEDARKYDLMPAIELLDRAAGVTELDYLSCEIAVTSGGSGQPRFVLTDLNADPRDLIAVDERPDEWGKWACERIAEFVWRKQRGVTAPAGHAMWLPSKSGAAVGEAKPSIVTAA